MAGDHQKKKTPTDTINGISGRFSFLIDEHGEEIVGPLATVVDVGLIKLVGVLVAGDGEGAGPLKVDDENAEACPAAVDIELTVFAVAEPAVFHLHGHVALAEVLAFFFGERPLQDKGRMVGRHFFRMRKIGTCGHRGSSF